MDPISSFLRNFHVDFHSGCTRFHFYQHWRNVLLSPQPHQHLLRLAWLQEQTSLGQQGNVVDRHMNDTYRKAGVAWTRLPDGEIAVPLAIDRQSLLHCNHRDTETAPVPVRATYLPLSPRSPCFQAWDLEVPLTYKLLKTDSLRTWPAAHRASQTRASPPSICHLLTVWLLPRGTRK